MPAAVAVSQAIDWPGIRANAVSMGIRAAARAAAVNLPDIERERFVFRVLKRAAREKWEDAKTSAVSAIVVRNEKPVSSNVLSGSDAIAAALAAESDATRVGFARAARKVAVHAGEMEGEALMDKDTAQAARHWSGVASNVHGWEAKQDQGGRVMINIGILEQ